jgi:hypothetical protein
MYDQTGEDEKRARIPSRVAAAFDVVPVSNLQTGGEKRTDKFRKLKNTMTKMRSKKK